MGEVNQCKVHTYSDPNYKPQSSLGEVDLYARYVPIESGDNFSLASSNRYLDLFNSKQKKGLNILMGCSGSKDEDKSTVGCSTSFFDEIQDAVDSASDGDVIRVCGGTYSPFIVTNKSLTIEAVEGKTPKIKPTSSSSDDAVVQVYYDGTADFEFNLDGFQIAQASNPSGEEAFSHNGGVYILDEGNNASINLSNLDVSKGSSGFGTGIGIYIEATGSINLYNIVSYNNHDEGIKMMVGAGSNVTLENIEAYENSGYAIYLEGAGDAGDTILEATNLSLHDGKGGITLNRISSTISDSEIYGQTTSEGSAIYLINSDLTLNATDVKYNSCLLLGYRAGVLQLAVSSDENTSTVTASETNWYRNGPNDVSAQDPDLSNDDLGLYYDVSSTVFVGGNFYCEYNVGCMDLE